ncbi:hypothetical protein WG66_005664 [Moniliophthora roreri]|nr:hypothetical protein WG66_005664 [Moniliophthora roreri]
MSICGCGLSSLESGLGIAVIPNRRTPDVIDEGLFCEYKSAARGRERVKTTSCTYRSFGDLKEWGWSARMGAD